MYEDLKETLNSFIFNDNSARAETFFHLIAYLGGCSN